VRPRHWGFGPRCFQTTYWSYIEGSKCVRRALRDFDFVVDVCCLVRSVCWCVVYATRKPEVTHLEQNLAVVKIPIKMKGSSPEDGEISRISGEISVLH
jgi:hypothetical protein